jgi:hypothetical protein
MLKFAVRFFLPCFSKRCVIRLDALLAMKREAGRPQDLADIADLERIQKLKHEFGK